MSVDVTAGRLYSVVNYPRVLQVLRDLSGQGLISRFTKAQFEREDLAAQLEEFVPGTGCTAREKNRLFNFVWDLTCGNNANRVAAFEHVNSTPPAASETRIYESQYRKPWTTYIENLVGLPKRKPESAIRTVWCGMWMPKTPLKRASGS